MFSDEQINKIKERLNKGLEVNLKTGAYGVFKVNDESWEGFELRRHQTVKHIDDVFKINNNMETFIHALNDFDDRIKIKYCEITACDRITLL